MINCPMMQSELLAPGGNMDSAMAGTEYSGHRELSPERGFGQEGKVDEKYPGEIVTI